MKKYGPLRPKLLISMLVFLLSGCATTGKSMGLGATGGAGIGAGVGALADPGPDGSHRVRNVLIGAGAGAALGAGAGYLLHESNESNQEQGYEKGKQAGKKEIEAQANSADANPPRLIPARTEARWVPDLVRSNTFVPGHFEYVILEGARWDLGH